MLAVVEEAAVVNQSTNRRTAVKEKGNKEALPITKMPDTDYAELTL